MDIRQYLLILAFIATSIPFAAHAQMDIDDIYREEKPQRHTFTDTLRLQPLTFNYYSAARERYQRAQVRKQRNVIEVNSALQGSLTNLSDSWIETSGGDNTITLLGSFSVKHTYTKGLFSLSTYLSAKFGYYRVMLETTLDDGAIDSDPVWYKNQDELQFSLTPSYKFSDNWSYGATVKFRSQFAKGYVSSASQADYNLKSDFLSPGYLDVSGGLIYKCPHEKLPFTISISPIAMSAIYVTNQQVKDNAQFAYADPSSTTEAYLEPYGVSPYSSSKYEGGSSIQIDFDKYFGKNKFLRYTTSLYSFYGWMTQLTYSNIYSDIDAYEAALTDWNVDNDGVSPILTIHPTVRWENKIEIKASKLISTTLSFQLYYNRAQNYDIQTQTLLSVGVSYTFKSNS